MVVETLLLEILLEYFLTRVRLVRKLKSGVETGL